MSSPGLILIKLCKTRTVFVPGFAYILFRLARLFLFGRLAGAASRMLAEHHSRAGGQIERQTLDSGWCIERIGYREVLYAVVDIAEAAEYGIVGGEYDTVDAAWGENAIVVEALDRVEIEHEHKIAAHESQNLVVVFLP